MVKYIILADSSVGFEIPKQLSIVCNEPIIKRTIRLLKENGIKDIIITSHDKRFDNLGVERYEPLHNYYVPNFKDYKLNKGYWLNAFPIELLNEPICFLFGDVYYSENAIKTIVETPTDSTLFFCSYENKDKKYIKHHDEPLAYKVVDYELFKKHIKIVKKFKDKGKCCREPIVWELYRSINGQDINEHKMTNNYIAINDESCDIDTTKDIKLLNRKLGGIEMIKLQAIESFTLERFDELENIERAGQDTYGRINTNDKFECTKDLANYLLGDNPVKRAVVKVIEVIPEIKAVSAQLVEHLKKAKNDVLTVTTATTATFEMSEAKPKKTTKKKTSKK